MYGEPANDTSVVILTSHVSAREVVEVPLVRLQTVDLNPETINCCLRINERIGKAFFLVGFNNRIGDFLELSEVAFQESEEGTRKRGIALTEYVR